VALTRSQRRGLFHAVSGKSMMRPIGKDLALPNRLSLELGASIPFFVLSIGAADPMTFHKP
jgi:hypothetical protein